jgi:stage II sporulation protein D
MKFKIFLFFSLFLSCFPVFAQVRIRLFADQFPESAVFSVTKGSYQADCFNGSLIEISVNDPVILMKYNGKLMVKKRNTNAVVCDSVIFSGKSEYNSFSLRINGGMPLRQFYSGDLQCLPDMGTLLFINISDIERYIAGVVMAEGGKGNKLEYFKTQAIIARTYMYKYFDKHLQDRYNVCDNTHCQAYKGLSSDSLLNRAAFETKGQVILGKDSVLIVAAFHSNCGGQTSSSADVWLSGQPYLKSVKDPYCTSSRSALWEKKLSIKEWEDYLSKYGYQNGQGNLNFIQESRLTEYKTGSFSLPLITIRNDLKLRSTFFSVYASADSVMLKGRGYGHGVGLCQEGAMNMALKGFNYRQIINFYYTGVIISDVKNAVALPQ